MTPHYKDANQRRRREPPGAFGINIKFNLQANYDFRHIVCDVRDFTGAVVVLVRFCDVAPRRSASETHQ